VIEPRPTGKLGCIGPPALLVDVAREPSRAAGTWTFWWRQLRRIFEMHDQNAILRVRPLEMGGVRRPRPELSFGPARPRQKEISQCTFTVPHVLACHEKMQVGAYRYPIPPLSLFCANQVSVDLICAMNRNTCDAIDEAIKPHETWKTEKILVPAEIIQLEDGIETIDTHAGPSVNLADYIGKDCKKRAATLKFQPREEWSDYTNEDCRADLISAIKTVCAFDSGFKAVCKGWERKWLALVFACHRGRRSKKRTGAPPGRQRRTTAIECGG
jgi:hypothetical protein